MTVRKRGRALRMVGPSEQPELQASRCKGDWRDTAQTRVPQETFAAVRPVSPSAQAPTPSPSLVVLRLLISNRLRVPSGGVDRGVVWVVRCRARRAGGGSCTHRSARWGGGGGACRCGRGAEQRAQSRGGIWPACAAAHNSPGVWWGSRVCSPGRRLAACWLRRPAALVFSSSRCRRCRCCCLVHHRRASYRPVVAIAVVVFAAVVVDVATAAVAAAAAAAPAAAVAAAAAAAAATAVAPCRRCCRRRRRRRCCRRHRC